MARIWSVVRQQKHISQGKENAMLSVISSRKGMKQRHQSPAHSRHPQRHGVFQCDATWNCVEKNSQWSKRHPVMSGTVYLLVDLILFLPAMSSRPCTSSSTSVRSQFGFQVVFRPRNPGELSLGGLQQAVSPLAPLLTKLTVMKTSTRTRDRSMSLRGAADCRQTADSELAGHQS